MKAKELDGVLLSLFVRNADNLHLTEVAEYVREEIERVRVKNRVSFRRLESSLTRIQKVVEAMEGE